MQYTTALFTPILFLLPALTSAQIACIQVVTTTITLEPALSAHAAGAACPTNYYAPDGATTACCPSSATVRILSGGGVACCPCGAFCTGDAAPTLLSWGASGSGSLSASTVRLTTSTSVSGVRSGTSSLPIVTLTSTSRTVSGSAITGASGSSTGSSSASSTSSATATQTANAASDVDLAPATFISGAFVVLALVRGMWA